MQHLTKRQFGVFQLPCLAKQTLPALETHAANVMAVISGYHH